MKKFTNLRFCFPILCVLLLPGCKELFHPDSGDKNNNGTNLNPGQNGGAANLSAPTGLYASINNGYLYASWNAVNGAEWYEGFTSDNPNGNYEIYPDRAAENYFSIFVGTDSFYDIYLRVRACKNGEEGPLSDYYHLSSSSGNTPPPSNSFFTVNAAAWSSNSVYLNWFYSGAAQYYRVLRSQSISGPYSTAGSYTMDLFYEDNGLSPGTTYYYKIEAYSSSYAKIGESDPVSTATQQAAPEETEIPLSYNQWTANTLPAGATHRYTFNAESGTTYYIRWDDSFNGSSTYTCDIKVSASINGTVLFSGEDDGYSTPLPVGIRSGSYVTLPVIITVEGYGSFESGSYAIMYY
jgi:hypothetical protein